MLAIEVVSGQIYRGRQPVESGEWLELLQLGIKTIVKLNYPDEGSDEGADERGFDVLYYSMPPRDLLGALGKPEPELVAAAVAAIADPSHHPVFVHCTHDEDRTSLVVGEYRVLHQGWSTWAAFREMLQFGFHPELPDLMETWLEFALEQERGALSA